MHFSKFSLSWLFPLLIWWLLCSLISPGNSSPLEKARQCCTLSKNPDDVRFLLYPDLRNSNSFDEIKFDNAHSLAESRFQVGLRTILITHGCSADVNSMACQLIKNELLGVNVTANVIIVDWGPTPLNGFFLNDYEMVVENIPIVGKRVAEFVVFLEEHGNVGLDDFYLIGHSMGAHVVGKAGKVVVTKIDHQVGGLTGLHHEGQGFYPMNLETLMEKRAKFTDVIHTNMGQLRDMTLNRQADFYPKIFLKVLDFFSLAWETVELSHDPNDVHFFLFPDPSDPTSFDEIIYNDPASLQNSRFQPGKRTVIITHGFRSNVSSDMPQTLKNAFLASGLDYNVVVTCWGALATPLPAKQTINLYLLVPVNVPIVAERLASFLIFLRENNAINFKDLRLIGHSLGVHVSGLTGRNIQKWKGEKLPRITGLDPAGPLYFPPLPSRNIMKENAEYVDIIHTNMGILGDLTRDGHADFYPNGGVKQANCWEGDHISSDTLGRCSHWFSYRLYAASLTKDFTACSCTPFLAAYQVGLCAKSCRDPVKLGYNSDPSTRGEFYLTTTNPP